jgi:hypothetical protein
MKSFVFILGVALMGCAYINAGEPTCGKDDCGCKKRKHTYESSRSYLSNEDSSFERCPKSRHHGYKRFRR